MSENGIILKYVLQLMMNHKVVRQHVWGVVGYLMSPCYKFPTESYSERILKVGQYLVKLWARVGVLFF